MRIKLPKLGIIYTCQKDGTHTAKRQFINHKLTTMLQSQIFIQSKHLEIDVNIPVAYIDYEGNDLLKQYEKFGLVREWEFTY